MVFLLPGKEVTLRLLIHGINIVVSKISVVLAATLLGTLSFGVETLKSHVVHVVCFTCYFDVVSEFDAFTLTHLRESSCDLFDDSRGLKLMQLEHKGANHDETNAEDDREQTHEHIVLVTFCLQLADVVVEIVFLVSAERRPHIRSNRVHI